MTKHDLLKQLAKSYGFDSIDKMIESCVIDSVAPGICVRCGDYAVASCLALYGII